MTRYWLIAAFCAVAAFCLIQTAEGKSGRQNGAAGGNACAQRCIRDCRSRQQVRGFQPHLKVCTKNCLRFAQTCSYCSNVVTGCIKCARGYTMLYGNQCFRPPGPPFEQWVAGVDSFSSENSSTSGSASQIIGPPDVYPENGDNEAAWSQLYPDSRDYIVVHFAEPVYASEINVYETFNAGGTVAVSLYDETRNGWFVLWEASGANFVDKSRILVVAAPLVWTRKIRVGVDSRFCGSRVEIDAVKLKGYKNIKEGGFQEVRRRP